MSSHDPRMHVGLGTLEKAEEVVVTWPDGRRAILQNVATRQTLLVPAPASAAQ